jgi:signal transduction histidine kinase
MLLDQGLRDTLRSDYGGDAVVYSEFLDIARLPEAELQEAQLTWLRRKYAEQPPHAVVAFGTSTARRLVPHDEPLFPGAVRVFAALDPLLFPGLEIPPDAEALWVRYDVGGTLDLALHLQPAAPRVLLVAGTAPFDRAMLAQARREVAAYAEQVPIEEVADLPLDELAQYVAGLHPDTVVIFLAVNRDGAGTPLAVGEGLRRVLGASTAPVYANTETSIGVGIVGGVVTSYATLGAAAARAAMRRRENPSAAPDSTMTAVAPKPVFDWRQLQRWGLREDRTPPGSEIRYRPPGLWEEYRWYVVAALLLIVSLSLLVTMLLVERSHRLRTQTALGQRQQELERASVALRGRTLEVQERNERIRTLAAKLISAQEEERAQIARELHDEVGQALTFLKLNLETMRSEKATSLPPLIDDGVRLVERTLDQVRDLSVLLRPSLLDHLGLEAALRWLVNSQAQRIGYHAIFTGTDLQPPPSPDTAITCYRVAQEALTNVARHAHARNVWVGVQATRGQLLMTIRDDGDGFDLVAMRQRAMEGGSMGLLSLEERARLGHGRLSIDSVLGSGTIVTLTLPYLPVDLPGQDGAADHDRPPAGADRSDH